MKKCLFFVLVALLALSSCGGGGSRPKVFLDEPQMIDVLTDVYLIEAQLSQKRSQGAEVSSLQRSYYDQLFEHYGIDDSLYTQNIVYYTSRPAVLERIMDSVTNRFVKAKR